jgi:hypothetical protein
MAHYVVAVAAWLLLFQRVSAQGKPVARAAGVAHSSSVCRSPVARQPEFALFSVSVSCGFPVQLDGGLRRRLLRALQDQQDLLERRRGGHLAGRREGTRWRLVQCHLA